MATTVTFWHDGASFVFAYALYTDVELTIPAPDGWYSEPVSSSQTNYLPRYVRQQLNGKLEPYAQC
jgi:hypothetical protein|tara:strand:- start:1168 stop:1365 length:198 start_codon:yes stop_codon:yes gene_type:complete